MVLGLTPRISVDAYRYLGSSNMPKSTYDARLTDLTLKAFSKSCSCRAYKVTSDYSYDFL